MPGPNRFTYPWNCSAPRSTCTAGSQKLALLSIQFTTRPRTAMGSSSFMSGVLACPSARSASSVTNGMPNAASFSSNRSSYSFPAVWRSASTAGDATWSHAAHRSTSARSRRHSAAPAPAPTLRVLAYAGLPSGGVSGRRPNGSRRIGPTAFCPSDIRCSSSRRTSWHGGKSTSGSAAMAKMSSPERYLRDSASTPRACRPWLARIRRDECCPAMLSSVSSDSDAPCAACSASMSGTCRHGSELR
mmetsp:Transcript_34621/g.86862  ORF Transcript_34621/g.86862 Transcript_34621/m.86862 type:complete len:245 (+) Transcript_34621:306-1040(+)